MPRVLTSILAATVLAACSESAVDPGTDPTSADADASLAMSQSERQGTTLEGLRNANWDCQQRGPTFIACAPPGIGLPPIPPLGEDGRPVYQLAVFMLDGTPVGTAHFLRADLYHGQTCAFTGQPFVFREIIGYYECFRPA
jgi:hypothetical protein